MSIKAIKSGIGWTAAERIIGALVSLLQLLVVVRYIPAAEIGVMAMASSALAFIGLFSGHGLMNSILHHQEERKGVLLGLFLLYTALGVVLSAFCYLLAPWVARFFAQPVLTVVFRVSALSLLLSGVGHLSAAMLYKATRYRVLAIAQLTAVIGASTMVILLAINGYGVFALAAGVVVSALLRSSLLLFFQPPPLNHFSMIRSIQLPLSHLRFGGYQTGESLLIYLSTQLDIILVGKLLGEETLGVYDVMKKLLQRPMRLVNGVVTRSFLPVMAKAGSLKQKGILYLRQLALVCSLNFPLYFFLMFFASSSISLLLSDRYLSSEYVLLFQLFCAYFMMYTVQNPIGTLLVATGKVNWGFWYNLGVSTLLPILIGLSAPFGVVYLVSVMLFFQSVMVFVTQRGLLWPAAKIKLKVFGRTFFLPMVAGGLAFGISKSMTIWFSQVWIGWGVGLTLGGLLYIGLVFWWNVDARLLLKIFGSKLKSD